jgi:hypothetical protein
VSRGVATLRPASRTLPAGQSARGV